MTVIVRMRMRTSLMMVSFHHWIYTEDDKNSKMDVHYKSIVWGFFLNKKHKNNNNNMIPPLPR